jgi:16S rRNA (guanine527-N7)-methyltransferase
MPAPTLEQQLHQGLAALGLPLTAAPRLLAFQAELEKWNATYNLTAIRDPAEMVTRHLLDSLSLLPLLKGRVLDVGAGAGLPCIPVAIVAPELHITGVDSIGKKVRFMRHAQRTLGLANFTVIEGRVEDIPADEGYQTITSRAFASLSDFFTLTRHLLAADGVWVAMKGKLEADELAAIPNNVDIIETRSLLVPGLREARHAVIAKPKK